MLWKLDFEIRIPEMISVNPLVLLREQKGIRIVHITTQRLVGDWTKKLEKLPSAPFEVLEVRGEDSSDLEIIGQVPSLPFKNFSELIAYIVLIFRDHPDSMTTRAANIFYFWANSYLALTWSGEWFLRMNHFAKAGLSAQEQRMAIHAIGSRVFHKIQR